MLAWVSAHWSSQLSALFVHEKQISFRHEGVNRSWDSQYRFSSPDSSGEQKAIGTLLFGFDLEQSYHIFIDHLVWFCFFFFFKSSLLEACKHRGKPFLSRVCPQTKEMGQLRDGGCYITAKARTWGAGMDRMLLVLVPARRGHASECLTGYSRASQESS